MICIRKFSLALIDREGREHAATRGVIPTGCKRSEPQRLQRMNTNMHHCSWNSVSGSWRNRICGILLGLGFVLFSLGAVAQNSQASAPPPAQSANPDTGSANASPESTGVNPQAQNDSQAQNDLQAQSVQGSEAGSTAGSQSMSSEQIISILR